MADSSTTAAGPSQATSDERTPLLSPDDRAEERTTDNPNDDTHIEDEEAVAGAAWSGSRPKFLYGLVITSLVASILLLIDFVVIAIAASNQPQLFHMPYGLVGNFKGFTAFGVLAAVSSLVSVLRLRRGRPDHWATVNFFTVLVDLFLVFGLAALVEPGIEELSAWYPSRRCATYFGHPPDPGAVEECERFAKKILVALWGFVLLGAIVALTHLPLLVMRLVFMYKSRGTRRGTTYQFSLPSGQFTFEFTVKYLRLGQGREAPADTNTSPT